MGWGSGRRLKRPEVLLGGHRTWFTGQARRLQQFQPFHRLELGFGFGVTRVTEQNAPQGFGLGERVIEGLCRQVPSLRIVRILTEDNS